MNYPNLADSIQARLFILGCPRSGTTLLQSLLAANPQIQSFPESHFFCRLVDEGSLRTRFGIAMKQIRPRFKQYLEKELKRPDLGKYLPKLGVFERQYTDAFTKILDKITLENGKSAWLEKTPEHLSYVDYIAKRIRGAKFIHIIRNGDDVVASLYDVAHQYTQYFHVWKDKLDIDSCVQQWIRDVRKSYEYKHDPNHKIIKYEKLIEDSEATLQDIHNFIGIDYSETQLANRSQLHNQIALSQEPWKTSAFEPVRKNTSEKFMQIFNQEQRRRIIQQLTAATADLELFDELITYHS